MGANPNPFLIASAVPGPHSPFTQVGAGIAASNRSRRELKRASDRATQRQQALNESLQDRLTRSRQDEERLRQGQASRLRQRDLRRSSAGRSGTILTGPLGGTLAAPTASKTLLGS